MGERNGIFKIKPKYNLIYELGMPTGKKVANTFKIIIILLIIYIIYLVANKNFNINMDTIISGINILQILNYLFLTVIAILILKAIFNMVIQIIQYNSISYTFYDKYLVYEDSFLNQHIKTIQYANIREIEIRRNIWDRINGFGVIIIYTNAENEYKNGLVILGLKNPNEVYEKINSIIHNSQEGTPVSSDNNNFVSDGEDNFKNSLK
ncbi:MAG: PH domain-containing protein [Clostridia bacterium]|nr:PH domain-containing protein [Clostridia bacterium]